MMLARCCCRAQEQAPAPVRCSCRVGASGMLSISFCASSALSRAVCTSTAAFLSKADHRWTCCAGAEHMVDVICRITGSKLCKLCRCAQATTACLPHATGEQLKGLAVTFAQAMLVRGL